MSGMSGEEQLDRLNRREHVVTYELVQVSHPQRVPVVGEIRYLVPLIPNPAEPLSQMLPLPPISIVWNGTSWQFAGVSI